MEFFQHLNFFTGLATTAKDWQAEQAYHVGKRRLHHSCFIAPGVVRGEMQHESLSLKESLKVTVTDQGRVIVLPGYAIDGQGRDLVVPEPVELPEAPYFAPGHDQQLYVFIEFGEEPIDPRRNVLNKEYNGDAFIRERPAIQWADKAPDNQQRIELARVRVQAGQRITQERIDLSHVSFARTRHTGSHALRVQAGEAELHPYPTGQGLAFSADDEKVLIQAFSKQEDAATAIYVANVYPALDQEANDARIFWRIESSITPQRQIAYYLLLKNFGTKKVKVQYAVFRLNIRQT